jgi:DNA-binding transcriptional regulator YiaG
MTLNQMNAQETVRLQNENEVLRAALKACRAYMFSQGMTTRRFAEACGISPSQLSDWTAGVVNTEPDFVN